MADILLMRTRTMQKLEKPSIHGLIQQRQSAIQASTSCNNKYVFCTQIPDCFHNFINGQFSTLPLSKNDSIDNCFAPQSIYSNISQQSLYSSKQTNYMSFSYKMLKKYLAAKKAKQAIHKEPQHAIKIKPQKLNGGIVMNKYSNKVKLAPMIQRAKTLNAKDKRRIRYNTNIIIAKKHLTSAIAQEGQQCANFGNKAE